MNIYKIPDWLGRYIPDDYLYDFQTINDRLNTHKCKKANIDVSLIIPAFNEEKNIMRTIDSLSASKTSFSFEIIVVNNNSTDGTQELLDKLNVENFNQKIQGCGPSRQLGLENANGETILLADADCVYPDVWIDIMTKKIKEENYVCAYGKFAFIVSDNNQGFYFLIHKILRQFLSELRNFKRPFLNAGGASMAFPKDLGLEIGFDMRNMRGEDGRMCFDLMRMGKVCYVRNEIAIVWTGDRALLRDGNLNQALIKRVYSEIKRFGSYFTALPDHDTKTSDN